MITVPVVECGGSIGLRAAITPEELANYGPVIVMSQEYFNNLGTYDHSLPTGTSIGKRWKKSDGKGGWKMGEYVADADPKKVGIRWTTIRVQP